MGFKRYQRGSVYKCGKRGRQGLECGVRTFRLQAVDSLAVSGK